MDMLEILKKIILVALFVAGFTVSVCADEATVISLKGKVEVNRKGAWVALAPNDKVAQGEIVSTGFKSEAVLKYQGSVMQLGPLTRITLEKLSQNSEKDTVSVYLNTGAIQSSVEKTENKRISYTVHNPIAVASVRGTEFSFNGSGHIGCSKGAVAAYPAALYKTVKVSDAGNKDTQLPAEGESNAGTSADDIAPNAPQGAVVVLAGQNVAFGSYGFTSKPRDSAAAAALSVSSSLNTPVDTESVITSSNMNGPHTNDQHTAAVKSDQKQTAAGTIKVTISTSDN
jgi:hypothetical protein